MTALTGLALAIVAVLQSGSLQAWCPSVTFHGFPLGIRYHLAADGISLTLVLLTGIAAVAGILFSWNIEHRVKEFFAFYLALIGGVYGVFLASIFSCCSCSTNWPSSRSISSSPSGDRPTGIRGDETGALLVGGVPWCWCGLIATYVGGMAAKRQLQPIALAQFPFPRSFQSWAFPVVFVGFAILAGLWPFHTWAPTGHVAAPTAASMLLAGVVMKLGAYGALRVAMTLFPLGLGGLA